MRRFRNWIAFCLTAILVLSLLGSCQLPNLQKSSSFSAGSQGDSPGKRLPIDAQAQSALAAKGITQLELIAQTEAPSDKRFQLLQSSPLDRQRIVDSYRLSGNGTGRKAQETFIRVSAHGAYDKDDSLYAVPVWLSSAYTLGVYPDAPPDCQPQADIFLDDVKLGTFKPQMVKAPATHVGVADETKNYYVPDYRSLTLRWRGTPKYQERVVYSASGGWLKTEPTQVAPYQLKVVMNPVYCKGVQPAFFESLYASAYTSVGLIYSRWIKENDTENKEQLEYVCPAEWNLALQQMYREAALIYDQTRKFVPADFKLADEIRGNHLFEHFQVSSAASSSKLWHPFYQSYVDAPPSMAFQKEMPFQILMSSDPSGSPEPLPSDDPSGSPEPSPSEDPSSDPSSSPDPTPEPTPEPTPDPTPDPTPEPTPVPIEPTPVSFLQRSSGHTSSFQSPLDVVPVQELLKDIPLGVSSSQRYSKAADFLPLLYPIRAIYDYENYPPYQVFERLIRLKEAELRELSSDDVEAHNQLVQDLEALESLERRMFEVVKKANSFSQILAAETRQTSLPGSGIIGCRQQPYQSSNGSPAELSVLYASLQSNGDLTIHAGVSGVAQPKLFDRSTLFPDFQGDIEVLQPPQVSELGPTRDYGGFVGVVLRLPAGSWRFTEQHFAKYKQGKEAMDDLKVSLTTQGFKTAQSTPSSPAQKVFVPLLDEKRLGEAFSQKLDSDIACSVLYDDFLRFRYILETLQQEAAAVKNMTVEQFLKGPQQVSWHEMFWFERSLRVTAEHARKHAQSCANPYAVGNEWQLDLMPGTFHVSVPLLIPALAFVLSEEVLLAVAASTLTTYYIQWAALTESGVDLQGDFARERAQDLLLSLQVAYNHTLGAVDGFWLRADEGEQERFRKNVLGGYGKSNVEELDFGDINDGFHHLVQKHGYQELVQAQSVMNHCFKGGGTKPWNSQSWQQGGVGASGVNGVPLHPWFHAYMHTESSRKNMRLFFLNMAGNFLNRSPIEEMVGFRVDDLPDIIKEVKEHCGIEIDPKEPCQGVNDFMENILKPYYEEKNIDYKLMVQDELKKYLGTLKKRSHIKKFMLEGEFFVNWKRSTNVGLFWRMGKILFNQSNHNYDANIPGLSQAERKEFYTRVKNRVAADNKKNPNSFKAEYVDKDYATSKGKSKSALASFCKDVKSYMSGRKLRPGSKYKK